jgi:hypothetical protein
MREFDWAAAQIWVNFIGLFWNSVFWSTASISRCLYLLRSHSVSAESFLCSNLQIFFAFIGERRHLKYTFLHGALPRYILLTNLSWFRTAFWVGWGVLRLRSNNGRRRSCKKKLCTRKTLNFHLPKNQPSCFSPCNI